MTRIAVLLVVACGAHSRVAQPGLRLAPCHVEAVAEQVRCGMLDVPEDRAHPEGRHLELPVVVLPGRAGGTPLFELLGGPGAPATSAAPVFAGQLAALRQVGDVVLVDQRGTGAGRSSLACDELDTLPPSSDPDPEAARRCRDKLAPHADLRFYTTSDAARDLDDARAALGYDRIDLEALSYGTRLAQVYLRMYPERVRAAVLFGTLAMDVHLPGDFSPNAQRVLDAILDDCEHDADCARRYPGVKSALASVPARPAFTEWIRHHIYSAEGAAELPQLIARAAAGDFSAFEHAPAPHPPFRSALLLAVTCSEDLPAIDLPAAIERARATWFGAGRLERQARDCDGWPRATLPPGFHEPVAAAAPVLAIAGERDPVTPPEYALRATREMPHARVVRVPALGHQPDGLVGAECIDRIELAFLRDPHAALDTSCVAATARPEFR